MIDLVFEVIVNWKLKMSCPSSATVTSFVPAKELTRQLDVDQR